MALDCAAARGESMLSGDVMRAPLLLVCLSVSSAGCGSDPAGGGLDGPFTLVSPDEATAVTLALDSPSLMYSIEHDGVTVIDESPLGIQSSTHDLGSGFRTLDVLVQEVDDRYDMLLGKSSERRVRGSEATFMLETAEGERLDLIVRVQDHGVAVRYRLLGEGEVTVFSESTGFAIPEGSRGVLRPFDDGPESFIILGGGYEMPPSIVPVGTPTDAAGWTFPALFEVDPSHYVMVTEADLDADYCGTRLHERPSGGLYRTRFPVEDEGAGVGDILPVSQLPLTTPWRAFIVGELSDVVESTLVEDLSQPSVVDDVTWIVPGRSAWSWLTQDTSGPELQEEYIDFASELGWEYVLIDARWDQWEDAPATVQRLVETANKKNVKLLLWYSSAGQHARFRLAETPSDRMLEPAVRSAEMEKIAGWGIAGIKVDFFLSDKQDRIQQYIGILEDAAKHQLLVNFHGSTVPRGWQRTYPHLMSMEAVNGAEQYREGFDALGDFRPDALHNVHLALSRNVVGSMDYTPVTFTQALRRKGLTYAHQMALSVLFESGIQHFADRADSNRDAGYRAVFGKFPFAKEFLSQVPVAWDETAVVTADIDSHVMVRRRQGQDWYVAGIYAGHVERSFELNLGFLGPGRFEAEFIGRGSADDILEHRSWAVDAAAKQRVTLQPKDGFVAVFRPQ